MLAGRQLAARGTLHGAGRDGLQKSESLVSSSPASSWVNSLPVQMADGGRAHQWEGASSCMTCSTSEYFPIQTPNAGIGRVALDMDAEWYVGGDRGAGLESNVKHTALRGNCSSVQSLMAHLYIISVATEYA